MKNGKKLSRILTSALLAALLLLLTACGGSSETSSYSTASYDGSYDYAVEDYDYESAEVESALTEESLQVTGSVETNRKLIRSATLTLETMDFDTAVSQITALVTKLGGYMETTQISGESLLSDYANERSAYFVARVPVSVYDQAKEDLEEIAYVRERTESAQDITDQYYDVQAELDSLNLEQERLTELMEKADKMEDIIALEQALTDVRTRINERTSTMARYDGLINYATISITVNEVVEVKELENKPATFGDRIAQTFRSSLEFVKDFGQGVVLVFVAVGPFVLIYGGALAVAGLLVWLCIRAVRRRKKKNAEKEPESGSEENREKGETGKNS